MPYTRAKNNLTEQLEQLVAVACEYPAGSARRRQKLNEIVRVVTKSGKLWHEKTPYYNDALQQTWLYFCRNPEEYDPNKASLITRLNNDLKWRLRKLRQINAEEQARKTSELREETLPGSPDVPPILEETLRWAQTDPDGELSSIHVKNRPDVTCQQIILRRLPPEQSWEKIAQEFNLPKSTAPNFYKRKCLPCLRKFGLQQGYLE